MATHIPLVSIPHKPSMPPHINSSIFKSLKPLPFLLHMTTAAVMAYGFFNCPETVANVPMHNLKGGRFQFLTIQGLCIAWLTMLVSIACDILPSANRLRTVKRVLLMSALPLAIVISVIYWTLFLAFPSLILMPNPSASEPTSPPGIPESQRLPLPLDLALHAAPAISMLVEFYFLEGKYPAAVSQYGALASAVVVGTWYSCWVEYCAKSNGFFPYPFLTYSSFNVRVAIYVGSATFAAISFITLNALHA